MIVFLPMNEFDARLQRNVECLTQKPSSWSSERKISKGLTPKMLQAFEQKQEDERRYKQEFERAFFNVYGSIYHSSALSFLSMDLELCQKNSTFLKDRDLEGNPYAHEGRVLL
jgi:hypothetical protein